MYGGIRIQPRSNLNDGTNNIYFWILSLSLQYKMLLNSDEKRVKKCNHNHKTNVYHTKYMHLHFKQDHVTFV